MPVINGLMLAEQLKRQNPDAAEYEQEIQLGELIREAEGTLAQKLLVKLVYTEPAGENAGSNPVASIFSLI